MLSIYEQVVLDTVEIILTEKNGLASHPTNTGNEDFHCQNHEHHRM